jgi:signal transduction histidine kinase
MSTLSRAILLAAALVAAFLLGALSLQGWLNRQAAALHAESEEKLRVRLAAAVALAPGDPGEWSDALRAELGRVLEAEVRLVPAGQTTPTQPQSVTAAVDVGEHRIEATAASPALKRFEVMQRRALAATLMLALLLGAVPVVIAALAQRRGPGDTRVPWRSDAAGFEQFARLTVERGAALEREQGARRRAEQDLQVSRTLLDRSLEERIRLGRELHDNVSQTLYGVALALESVRKKMTAAPEIEQRLDHCVAELRRLNQEVRAFLRGLEPEAVQRAPFAVALAETLAAAGSAADVQIEQRLDDDAVQLIPPQHALEIVNLVREAVSNSVRHGRARRITVRAARGERAVALAIADDGAGFSPSPGATASGHGLGNMRARAAAMGGALQIESAPGKGTRVLLTLPLDSASP